MGKPQEIGDLQIGEQDMDYQWRMWHLQRLAWAVFGLIVLLALLGLFGRGPLSAATASTETVRLEYERFGRLMAPLALDIYIRPSEGAEQNEASFWISRDYVESITIDNVVPEPQSVEFSGDGLKYVFDVDQPGEIFHATIESKPNVFGSHTGRIGPDGNTTTRFNQFVYP